VSTPLAERQRSTQAVAARPLLSVVVPVYNQAGSIAESVQAIQDRVAEALRDAFELVVVSDGSIDQTEERLLAEGSGPVRVIHYDRNLGKGYAVKIGSLASRGRWISFIDADLDLDPSSIVPFLDVARRESLDIAIGSKRHPDSTVHYPRSRRVASWLYQQLVRALFRLNVRDTQVGLKVFRREVAEQVMPLLLVKRYAFDLELLVVARALGFQEIRELPVSLKYRSTGSGVRSAAVLHALIDTAAIFYRLRILRYYERKRALLGGQATTRALDYRPLVSVIAPTNGAWDRLYYPDLEVVLLEGDGPQTFLAAARQARGEVLAVVDRGGVPAGNWLTGMLPFLADPQVAAVVAPTMAPNSGTLLERAAAAVTESRLGGGSLYFRFTPGNLRVIRTFPLRNFVIRRADFVAAAEKGEPGDDLCERLEALGKRIVYTPETVVVAPRPPLFRPHLAEVAKYGRARGWAIRRQGLRALRRSTVPPLTLVAFSLLGWLLLLGGKVGGAVLLALWGSYLGAIVLGGIMAAIGFSSWRVGLLAVAGFVSTHVTYGLSLARGILSRRMTPGA